MADRRIRVLFFEQGEYGGSVLCLSRMLEGLSKLSCDVACVSRFRKTGPVDLLSMRCLQASYCLNAPPGVYPRPEVGTHTLGVPRPTMHGLSYLRLSVRAMREFRPDVVYLNNGPESHIPALGAARLLRLPVISHLRTAAELTRWDRRCIQFLQRFVVLTKWGRRFYHDQGVPLGKICQIYNPFPLAEFERRSRERLNGLTLDGQSVYVVQVGALRDHKRPGLAIKAFALARKECPNLKLILVGDGPMREDLEQLVVALGLEDSVHFTGQCPQVPALLNKCHIGLLTSRSEGLGLCLLEYMAAGLPFISCALPVLPEIVNGHDSCILVGEPSPSALAEALGELYRSPERRDQMGRAGRQSLSDGRFSPEAHVRRVRDMLAEVVAGQA